MGEGRDDQEDPWLPDEGLPVRQSVGDPRARDKGSNLGDLRGLAKDTTNYLVECALTMWKRGRKSAMWLLEKPQISRSSQEEEGNYLHSVEAKPRAKLILL